MNQGVPLAMQFRMWVEMHNGGLHPSLDENPISMFVRASGGQATMKKTSVNTNDSLSQTITQLTAALSPSSSHAGRGSTLGTSPAKLIDKLL